MMRSAQRERNKPMSHVDDKVIELARAALSFEFSSEPFFRHAAEMTRNDSGKKMFLRLATKDDERMDDLTRLFGKIIGNEQWVRLVAEAATNTVPSTVVAEMDAEVARRGHGVVADDTQALRLAMELIRRFIHVFKDLASHTSDRDIIKLADKILEGEFYRYDDLQAQLDSVINTGLWLDSPEFRMDAKF
jgi:rubrerythrin